MPSRSLNIFFRSLGCKVNLADAAAVVDLFDPRLHRLVDEARVADVAFLNTCTVTHKADRDVRKILGALQQNHPELPVVVTGCAVLTLGSSLSNFRNVRALIPPGDPGAVARAIVSNNYFPQPEAKRPSPFFSLKRQRAIVKVQDGCNSRCTYCVVPQVRGPERSLSHPEVVNRVGRLIDQQHHEVILSGIHLGRYGNDLSPPSCLTSLLVALAPHIEKHGPDYRIRLSSIEPMEWTEELMEVIAHLPFVCPHFHIPLQSGDDRVLERMGRPYRATHFRKVIETLHERFPQAALGTDILVGFPGETESEARITINLVRSLPLSYLHVFTFSPRPGTLAEKMPHSVVKGQIRQRARAIRMLGFKHWHVFLSKGVGRRHVVVIEKRTPSASIGRTQAYHPIRVEQTRAGPGEVLEVVAEYLDGDTLVGVPLSHYPLPLAGEGW